MGVDRDDRSKTGDSPSASVAPFPTRLPPPVAMSLRTRESSSLALKHIFDQINATAENSQPTDSLFGRTVAVLDKKDDGGKRDGSGVVKEFSGMGWSAGSEMDARLRTGGVHFPRKQGIAEDWTSFRFKSSDSRSEECKRQQVNRGPPPRGFAEPAHTSSQLPSEKDLRCGFQMPERTLAPRFHDAGGNREYYPKVPQEELANVLPQTPGVASLPHDLHLKKCLPELDLSFQKSQSHDSNSLSPAETAFGSPISAPSQQSLLDTENLPNFTTASWSMRGIQQGFLPQAVSRSNTANTPSRLSTAQLTIFYSGMVNVYDDVPADKANAIMLLAGNGNSWSTNHRTSPPERERVQRAASPSAIQPPVAVPANVAMGSVGTGTTSAKTFGSAVAASSSLCPSTTPTTPAADPKLQTPAKRTHPGIELPHARKASLTRFLEKRKDRAQVKQQGGSDGQENAKASCPKKQRSARSRSPSPTRSTHGNSPSMGQLSSAAASPVRFLD